MTCWASPSAASARPPRRRSGGSAYAAQVTYAPVSEIGFDVLRDRLATDVADLVTTGPDVVLIDEADSVLIDEALVPLVLAGSSGQGDADLPMAEIVAGLRPRLHYRTDDDGRNVQLTDAGIRAAERALGGIDLYAAGQLGHADPAQRGPARSRAAAARRRLHRPRRPGPPDQRLPRPGRPAPAVARRPAGRGGGQGGLAATESGEILDSITVESLSGATRGSAA